MKRLFYTFYQLGKFNVGIFWSICTYRFCYPTIEGSESRNLYCQQEMGISVDQRRLRIGCFRLRVHPDKLDGDQVCKINFMLLLVIACRVNRYLMLIRLLLMICGDVELNLGQKMVAIKNLDEFQMSALCFHAKAESHKKNNVTMSVSFVNLFVKKKSKQKVSSPTSTSAEHNIATLTVLTPHPIHQCQDLLLPQAKKKSSCVSAS